MTQTQSFLHMTSLMLGLAALALALGAMPAELRSRFRAEPVELQSIDPAEVATARGQRLLPAAGDGGAVSANRQRN